MKLFEKSSLYLSIILILLEASFAFSSKDESVSSSSTCVDTYAHCARRAFMGQCKLYPKKMMHFCCNSCTNVEKVKPVSPYKAGCSDTVRDCVKRAIMGQCEKYRPSMMYHCCESCTKLKEAEADNAELALINTESPECFNYNQRCEVFVSLEACKSVKEFSILCCKSCENLERTTIVNVPQTVPTTSRETESTTSRETGSTTSRETESTTSRATESTTSRETESTTSRETESTTTSRETESTNVERETSTISTTFSDECFDITPICEKEANRGHCETVPGFMFEFCCKSCESLGFIDRPTTPSPPEPQCIDTSSECWGWANSGHCGNTSGMLELCCWSCSLVGVTTSSQV